MDCATDQFDITGGKGRVRTHGKEGLQLNQIVRKIDPVRLKFEFL